MTKNTEHKKNQVWAGRLTEIPSSLNVLYCAGRDVVSRPPADEILIPYDLWLNRSHVIMLTKQGLIDLKSSKDILSALKELAQDFIHGNFKLDPLKEDVHLNIEEYVKSKVGEEIAGKMHTGKSRNDQTTTDIRLYMRDKLLELYDGILELTEVLLQSAERSTEIVMPGFTHGQPASVTTLGHWFAAQAQSFIRDLDRFQVAYSHINYSPMGAAAAFGTSWNINRVYSAQLLGFEGVQENSLDCITSRWEPEAETISAMAFFMTHLSILSQDIYFFSDPFKKFFIINDKFVTGSSIMPQKRNPDFIEVTRAKASFIHSALQNLYSIAKASLSGYNRDTQWTKYIIIDAFDEVRYAPQIFSQVCQSLSIDIKKMYESACSDFINSVDIADFLAQKLALPFRKTYSILSEAVKSSEKKGIITQTVIEEILAKHNIKIKIDKGEWDLLLNPSGIITRKISQGSPNPQCTIQNIINLKDELKRRRNFVKVKRNSLEKARKLIHEETQNILSTNII